VHRVVEENTIQYDTIEEFNVNYKAECEQLNLAHVTKTKKNKQTSELNDFIKPSTTVQLIPLSVLLV